MTNEQKELRLAILSEKAEDIELIEVEHGKFMYLIEQHSITGMGRRKIWFYNLYRRVKGDEHKYAFQFIGRLFGIQSKGAMNLFRHDDVPSIFKNEVDLKARTGIFYLSEARIASVELPIVAKLYKVGRKQAEILLDGVK